MKDFSYITHSHPAYIEGLYNDYVQNPDSVDPEYRKFFEGFDFAITSGANGQAAPAGAAAPTADGAKVAKELAVYSLIDAYRRKAHLVAHTNPIRPRKDRPANLEPRFFGLADADLTQTFAAGKAIGLEGATLQAI
ncbi:MAG: 2-oxoglutarate dehydrogenase E1 subunit family protein, partial [Chitinophagaceae bacterium]